ncbi:hypothetical protein [Algibacillus agarilyticus]|uniref:hypothetical protein n=1 Tax=Algibacillus agarilyticus TaxID=2234133 RepID=UPI00130023A1|nr:hypothetical protein [Algibacillus agarilyticus]
MNHLLYITTVVINAKHQQNTGVIFLRLKTSQNIKQKGGLRFMGSQNENRLF